MPCDILVWALEQKPMASEKKSGVQCVVTDQGRSPRFDERPAAVWEVATREGAVKGMQQLCQLGNFPVNEKSSKL